MIGSLFIEWPQFQTHVLSLKRRQNSKSASYFSLIQLTTKYPFMRWEEKNQPYPFITTSLYVKDLRVVITIQVCTYIPKRLFTLDKILSDLLDLPNLPDLTRLSLLPNLKIIELQTDKTFEDDWFAFFLCTSHFLPKSIKSHHIFQNSKTSLTPLDLPHPLEASRTSRTPRTSRSPWTYLTTRTPRTSLDLLDHPDSPDLLDHLSLPHLPNFKLIKTFQDCLLDFFPCTSHFSPASIKSHLQSSLMAIPSLLSVWQVSMTMSANWGPLRT